MIRNATKAIAEALDAAEIKYRITEPGEGSTLIVGFKAENVSSIEIKFISLDDDNDVAVRLFSLVKVPENKTAQVLTCLNELNGKFRYVNFYIDSDNDVTISYDFPVRTTADNVGAIGVEMTHRFVKIADEAYPMIMKAIWG